MIKKNPLALAVGSIVLTMGYPAVAQTDITSEPLSETSEIRLESTTVEGDLPAVGESRKVLRSSVDEVIVTGSRIAKDVFSSTSPIDVIQMETAEIQGISDIGTLLQTTTVASGSPQVTAASSTAFVQNGGTGAQTISLRGLGANRTLVLLNGRRAGPAGVRGGVSSFDLNVIPLSAVERVEVLKDGASSIYGSDAVAGVVNIITDRSDASSFNVFASQPGQSGGETTRVDFTFANSTDKFHYRVTGDYYKQEELAKGDRDYFRCGEQFTFDPTTGNRADVIDPRTGNPRCSDLLWGHVWIYDYSGTVPGGAKAQYDYDGDLGNYVPSFETIDGMTTPPGWFPVAYDRTSDGVTNTDHPFQDQESLSPKLERATFYAESTYDFSDNHQGYAELLLSRRETAVNSYRQYWSYTYNQDFFNGNAAPTAEGWTGAQWLSSTPITDQSDSTQKVDYGRIVAGMTGNISSDWIYDAYYQYSKSDAEYSNQRIFESHSRGNDFGSVNGDGTCAGTITSRGVPCQDLPWLDPRFLNGDLSDAEKAYLFGWETGTTEYEQDTFEIYASGPVLELPAGEVSLAVGIHYRNDEIIDTPGDITLGNDAWGSSGAGITKGKDTTKAVFAEIDVPLLEDLPLVKSLTLNASGRYTDVDSYGSGNTYKLGLAWEITDTVMVRAGHGTSFRTPALFELFLADQTSFIGQRSVDPCLNWQTEVDSGNLSQLVADNCASDGVAPDLAGTISATVVTGGGLGFLEAETSDTTTIGIVWQPEFADLKISADYFDIEVEDQVGRLSAAQIVAGCYYSNSFASEPLCRQFSRDATTGSIDNIYNSYINIAQQENRGWDFSMRYRTEVPWGELILDTQHTFQIGDSYRLYTDSEDISTNGELGEPKWTGRLSASLLSGDWGYFWNVNFIGDANNYGGYGGDTATYRGDTVNVRLGVDTVVYHSLSASYNFQDQEATLRIGVSNATDKKPPRLTTLNLGEVSTMGNSAFYSQYNWAGRTVFMNFSKAF